MIRVSRGGVSFLAALCWLIVLSHAAFAQTKPPLSPFPAPTFRAEEFNDFVAINDGPLKTRVYEDGPFKGAGTTFAPELFFDLGVRTYRTALRYDLTLPNQPEQVAEAYRKYGVRPLLLIDPHTTKTGAEVLAELKRYTAEMIAGIEGPNECNNKFPPQDLNLKFGGKTDEAAGAAFMDDVYKATKSDPATKNIPVVAYSAIFTDYRLARPHTGFDFANMHSYQGYDVPSSSLESNITRFNNILPPGATIKPFAPTECGYNVDEDKTNQTGVSGNLRAQALNIPMLLAEYFRHGVARAYLFAIRNADGYGLLASDLKTKRPSYRALQTFTAALKDATWNPKTLRWEGGDFALRALLFTLADAPPTVHTLTLQKRNGQYSLLIWNELRNYDSGSKKEIVNPPAPVTLKFLTPVQSEAAILTQGADGAFTPTKATVTGNGLKLSVPSSVMIVRLRMPPPPPGARIARPAPFVVKGLTGEATENQAKIRWQPSRGAAGYFILRNGQFLGATKATAFEDDSSWIRPGLGYTYTVQAYAADGRQSERASVVVVTPDKRPDLIVTGLRTNPADLKPGQEVKFEAVVRNIGPGVTPQGVVTSATFFVDGQFTSFSTPPGPMGPGEDRTLTASGGGIGGQGGWSATAGAHVVRVQLDDLNRIPNEVSKRNNVFDQTIVIGDVGKGSLLGRTEPTPGTVALTREGTEDWIAWAVETKDGVTRKAGGPGLFSPLTEIGTGYRDRNPGCATRLLWSDGTTPAKNDGGYTGLWWNGVGHGVQFTVPADTTERILRVYVNGTEGVRGKFEAKLSDDSAPPYLSTTWNGNSAFDWSPVPDSFAAVYTIRYRAASPNQKLTVTWLLDGEPNAWRGQAQLQAASLARAR